MANRQQRDTDVRQILHKDRVSTTTHNYFFEVKVANNGSKYIVIDQIKKQAGRRGEKTKLRIFEDELLEFQRILQKMIRFSLNDELPVLEKTTATIIDQEKSNSELSPSFFNTLLSTHDWKKFEQHTHYLLKLLGIQAAYKFTDDNHAGKADGFFRFGNLAVIYDCTLDHNSIESRKSEQIINYCNRLKQGSIELSGSTTIEFHHHQRQVWVITRAESRKIKLVNDIDVKEVSINNLISLYEDRLRNSLSDHQLEMKLRDL